MNQTFLFSNGNKSIEGNAAGLTRRHRLQGTKTKLNNMQGR